MPDFIGLGLGFGTFTIVIAIFALVVIGTYVLSNIGRK